MADILSLKRARKAKQRAAEQIAAAENRTVYGRTKAEKQHTEAEKAATARKVDAHKREKP